MGTPVRARRCRSIWRRPEDVRWVKRVLNEMIGDSWKTSSRQEKKKLQMHSGVYIALKRQIRYGDQKGCNAGVYSQELRTRLQNTVDNEVAQSGKASSIDSPGQTSLSFSSGPAPSSSSGTPPAAGRLAPEVGNVVAGTVAESSTTQPKTRSTIRETETEDQSNTKRQRRLASRADQYGADVNMGMSTTIVMAADPEVRDGWKGE